MSTIFAAFDFSVLNYAPPPSFKVVRANKESLILERMRDGFHEQFCIKKSLHGPFLLFRINLNQEFCDDWFTDKNRITSGELSKILWLLGYKTKIVNADKQTLDQ